MCRTGVVGYTATLFVFVRFAYKAARSTTLVATNLVCKLNRSRACFSIIKTSLLKVVVQPASETPSFRRLYAA